MKILVNIDLTKENRIVVVLRTAFQHLTKSPGTATYLRAAIPEIIDPSSTRDLVLNQYHNLLLLFTKKKGDKLQPHQYGNHAIPLIQDKKLPMGKMYSMSDSELAEVRK